ncbi:MAG TPA: head GIN domain-containing protein [Chitinophagaceae bacterium]
MKKIFSLLMLVASFSAITAQKTINDPNAEKRNVSGYHAISVSGGIDLYLSQGNESVAVSASEAQYKALIKTEVKDGVLNIWYDHKNSDKNRGDRRLKAYVAFKTLDKLTASGGSDIEVEGAIKVSTLKLDISGGSDFNGKVNANDLFVEASGGSDVGISGTVKKLEINASGGSDFSGYSLITDICDLEASGGSDVEITVNKELKAVASGSSDISYKGNAVVKDVKTSGSSSIKKI